MVKRKTKDKKINNSRRFTLFKIFKSSLKTNLKAFVRLHIELLGFFSTGLIGRSIYGLLLVSYFARVFNDLATSIIGYIIFYLFITGFLLFLAIKIPGTREKMFHMYGKNYIYERLGNPLGRFKDLLVATGGFVCLDEAAQTWQGHVHVDTAKEYDKDVRNTWREQSHTPLERSQKNSVGG